MSLPLILQYRDQLPPVVADELDQLMASLQTFLGNFGQRKDIEFQSRYFSVDSGTIVIAEQALRTFYYATFGNMMLVQFDISRFTVTGAPNIISISAPEGFRAKVGPNSRSNFAITYTQPIVIETDVGSKEAGEVYITNSVNVAQPDMSGPQVTLHCHQLDDGLFNAGSNGISLQGCAWFEYEKV